MTRTTYIWVNGKCVEKTAETAARRAGAYIQSDTIQPMRHPITGKLMDSKSQFRAVTRAHGCVEVGNDTQRDTRSIDMGPIGADIARAYTELGG